MRRAGVGTVVSRNGVVEGNGMPEDVNRRPVLAGGLTIGTGVAAASVPARAEAGAQPSAQSGTRAGSIPLTVNGARRSPDADTRTSLLDCLRDQAGLTGANGAAAAGPAERGDQRRG